MNNEEVIALANRLVDHDYYMSVVYENGHIVHEDEVGRGIGKRRRGRGTNCRSRSV